MISIGLVTDNNCQEICRVARLPAIVQELEAQRGCAASQCPGQWQGWSLVPDRLPTGLALFHDQSQVVVQPQGSCVSYFSEPLLSFVSNLL